MSKSPRKDRPDRVEHGVVKAWKMDRGYGFIAPDSGGEDVFVHAQNLQLGDERRDYLRIGEKVTFVRFEDERRGKERAGEVKGDGEGATPSPDRFPKGGKEGGHRDRGRGRSYSRSRSRGRGRRRSPSYDRRDRRRSRSYDRY